METPSKSNVVSIGSRRSKVVPNHGIEGVDDRRESLHDLGVRCRRHILRVEASPEQFSVSMLENVKGMRRLMHYLGIGGLLESEVDEDVQDGDHGADLPADKGSGESSIRSGLIAFPNNQLDI